MTTDSQTLIAAVGDGEMTDPGAVTTTQDVTDVVADTYGAVEEKLHDLEREGVLESTILGGEPGWLVAEADEDDAQPGAESDEPIGTATRDPLTT